MKIIIAIFLVFMMGCTTTGMVTGEIKLSQVESKFICMVNDDVYTTEQIPVVIDDKTYYGCCMGCKAKLENDPSIRFAVDPISGAPVDKATAIIGVDIFKTVYYFESLENLNVYK
jgi:YHS domain-containing protein